MKLIILATLAAVVFGDHFDQAGSERAIEYGLPFDGEVILNPFVNDSKSEFKGKEAVKVTSSSSHSHSFKNKTSHTSIHHGTSGTSGSIFHDLPHKNVASFITHHSKFPFNNRNKDGEDKEKVKSFISESTKVYSSKASQFDDGSYKSELYEKPDYNSYDYKKDAAVFIDGSHKQETQSLHDQQKIKSTKYQDVLSSDTSNYDDGSYKPELYEKLDTSYNSNDQTNDAFVFNDGTYKRDKLQNQQIIKSTYRDEYGIPYVNNNLKFKTNSEYGVPAVNDNLKFKTNSEYGVPAVYKVNFKAKDGTKVEEHARVIHTNIKGWEDVIQKTGRYEYISPEGTPIRVDWIADHNGYRATLS